MSYSPPNLDQEIFFDHDGKPCTLDKLCRISPEWAANRLRAERKSAEDLAVALAQVKAELMDQGDWDDDWEALVSPVLAKHYGLMRRD
jgi:hypothetical protein